MTSEESTFPTVIINALQSSLSPIKHRVTSAWNGHIPLMFALMRVVKPRVYVELGVHHGASFFAACQAVVESSLDTQCFAVDHWAGDPHAGSFDEDVFENFTATLKNHFSTFASYIRKDFQLASQDFADYSVDLLHIDGFHSYEAVEKDFLSWRTKLSEGSVVLFHDVNEFRGSFGVWRFWKELESEFEGQTLFLGNDHGLGILFYGSQLSEDTRFFLEWASRVKNMQFLQQHFAVASELQRSVLSEEKMANNQIGEQRKKINELTKQKSDLHNTLTKTQQREQQQLTTIAHLETRNTELTTQKSDLHNTLTEALEHVRILREVVTRRSLQFGINFISSLDHVVGRDKVSPRAKIRKVLQESSSLKSYLRNHSDEPDSTLRRPTTVKPSLGSLPLVASFVVEAKSRSHDSQQISAPARIQSLIPISKLPMNRFLRGAIDASKPERVSSFHEFLSLSACNPELLKAYLTPMEIETVGTMEAVREDLETSACTSTELATVLMATRNGFDPLMENAIYSVLLQTYSNLELIVLDHSGQLEHLQTERRIRDSRFSIVDVSDCEGIGAVRDRGVLMAQGKYLAWLDDDDIWSPSFLQILINQIEERGLDLAYAASAVFDGAVEATGLGSTFKAIRWAPYRRSLLENRNFIQINQMVHKRHINGEPVRVGLNYYEDWAIALQFAPDGRIGSVPAILAFYNQNARKNSLSASQSTQQKANDITTFRRWQSQRFPKGKSASSQFSFGTRLATGQGEPAKLAVVVPVYRRPELLEKLLESLISKGSDSVNRCQTQWVLVDNSPNQGNLRSLSELLSRRGLNGLVASAYDRGFSHAVNKGVESIKGPTDYIAVLNSDTEFLDGTLMDMLSLAQADPTIGMVVPEQIIDPRNPTFLPHWENQLVDFPIDVSVSSHHQNAVVSNWFRPEESLELSWAPFFCTLFPFDVWQGVGGLRASIGPHWSTDRIFCDLLRQKLGKKISRADGVRVFHQGGVETAKALQNGERLR